MTPVPQGCALSWGIKASFLQYVGRQLGSEASVGGGAGYTSSHEFTFPESTESTLDLGAERGVLKFDGDVRLRAHGGLLDLWIADPWVELDGPISTLSLAFGRSPDRGRRTVIASLERHPEPVGDDSVVLSFQAVLIEPGRWMFNDIYPVGQLLDPVRIRNVCPATEEGQAVQTSKVQSRRSNECPEETR